MKLTTALCAAVALTLTGCLSDSDENPDSEPSKAFQHVLDGSVTAIAEDDDTVLAAVGQEDEVTIVSLQQDGSWQQISERDSSVRQLVNLSENHFLLLDGMGIYQTLDHGESWTELESLVSGNEVQFSQLYYSQPTGLLFGRGGEWLAQSSDQGQSWQLLDGTLSDRYSSFATTLFYNEVHDQAWWSPRDADLSDYLIRYDLATEDRETWLFDENNSGVHIRNGFVHPMDDEKIVIAGSGVWVSTDNGGTWSVSELPEMDDVPVEWVQPHPIHEETIIAVGGVTYVSGDGTPPPPETKLYCTSDFGESWLTADISNDVVSSTGLMVRQVEETTWLYISHGEGMSRIEAEDCGTLISLLD